MTVHRFSAFGIAHGADLSGGGGLPAVLSCAEGPTRAPHRNWRGERGRPEGLDEDAAAIAAIEEINPTSIAKKWEYAGRIYQRSGHFYFTRATTIRSPDDSQAGAKVDTNIGTYHTHAGAFAPTDELFSPKDMLKATLGKELAYLGTPYQRVIKFTPVDLLPTDQQISYPLGKLDVLRNTYVLPEITITGRR